MRLMQRAYGEQATDWIERMAVGASVVCLVHCIGLPVLLAALPALVTIITMPESFHIWVLGLAIPMSGIALISGIRDHGTQLSFLVGCTGLGLLAFGALVLLGGRFETPVTISGGLVLATAHVLNWRRRHGRHGHG